MVATLHSHSSTVIWILYSTLLPFSWLFYVYICVYCMCCFGVINKWIGKLSRKYVLRHSVFSATSLHQDRMAGSHWLWTEDWRGHVAVNPGLDWTCCPLLTSVDGQAASCSSPSLLRMAEAARCMWNHVALELPGTAEMKEGCASDMC